MKGDELWAARAGISAGSAMILPVLLTEGVNRGRLTMSDVVRLTSYRAARLFGLYPRRARSRPAPTPISSSSTSSAR